MSKDRYELGAIIGTGHMSAGVHRATHKDLNIEVALKILELRHPDHREYILAEGARMAAIADHRNVVRVFDAGDWDSDHVYLAVELCEDGSLADECSAGPLDPQRACRLISDSCRGLQHLHAAGLLHLDIRPANILLANNDPKLADFGLARPDTDASLGTFYAAHSAPELMATGRGTAKADQYAMAMTLGHLLTSGDFCGGPLPMDPEDSAAWANRPSLETLGLNVSTKLRSVIATASAFKPPDRFDDVESFKRALDQATPRTALCAPAGSKMVSVGGEYEVSWSDTPAGDVDVELRYRGRRRTTDCRYGVTQTLANIHIRRLVDSIAHPSRR